MKDVRFTYRWAVGCELFMVFLWLLLVVSAFSMIIPNAESKVRAYFLAGLVGSFGTAAIFWAWNGTIKAIKGAVKIADTTHETNFLKKRIKRLESELALYEEDLPSDEDYYPDPPYITRKREKLTALRKKLQDLEYSQSSKE